MGVKLVLISTKINANKYGWLRSFVDEINVNLKKDFEEIFFSITFALLEPLLTIYFTLHLFGTSNKISI